MEKQAREMARAAREITDAVKELRDAVERLAELQRSGEFPEEVVRLAQEGGRARGEERAQARAAGP